MRRFAIAGLTAGALAIASAGGAAAWESYCDWDPPVLVMTPAGNVVTVYDSVWTSGVLNIGLPVESYTTARVYSPTGAPETAVDMAITVPAGLLVRFQTTDMVSTGLLGGGTVLARESGWSGQTLHLKFVLAQP